MDIQNFNLLLYIWIASALVLFPVQLKITAPYGRHSNTKWGIRIDNRLGWIIMELVSPLVFAYFFLTGTVEKSLPLWIFFSFWILHYFNRSLIFPLRMKTSGKKIPLFIVGNAIFFNLVNAWSNGYYLGNLTSTYSIEWLSSPQFIIGVLLFLIGAFINIQSDNILLNLRKPNEKGYKIPRGGLFRYVSCPNHFGEIAEWTGFAVMCWNLPALGFAIWTAANLIPRALSHHRWYQGHFEEYPRERRAVVPFLL